MLSEFPFADAHPETLLAAGYATLLLLVALGLERLAARSHRRAEESATTGFRYDRLLDHWECPTGEFLHLAELDQAQRLGRYRARPATCNRCPVKAQCTDSDDGREVVRSLDPWPQSEIAHFHRGISLLLLGLAGLIAMVSLLRYHADADLMVLAISITMTGIAVRRLLPGFLAERSR
jgi:hypothetical protein